MYTMKLLVGEVGSWKCKKDFKELNLNSYEEQKIDDLLTNACRLLKS